MCQLLASHHNVVAPLLVYNIQTGTEENKLNYKHIHRLFLVGGAANCAGLGTCKGRGVKAGEGVGHKFLGVKAAGEGVGQFLGVKAGEGVGQD